MVNISNYLSDEERQPCEIWTRVMGYHRPVSEFNKGKKSEFAARRCFVERSWFNENNHEVIAENEMIDNEIVSKTKVCC